MEIISENIIAQQQSVVAILRPASHSQISPLGKLLKLERTEIANVSQESVEKFLKAALNNFIERSGPVSNHVVTSSFYVDPTESSGYSIFTVLELEGVDISDEKIEHFKTVVSLLCAELIGQPSLFGKQKSGGRISHEDELFFRAEAWKFLQKFGGQRVKKEFYVHTGFEDREGVVVKDSFATVENSPVINVIEEGIARPDGYSFSGNEVYLLTVDGSKLDSQKTKFQCHHKSHYDTLMQACQERANLRFTAQRLKTASSKTEVLSLISLDLIASNENDFSLT